MKIFYITTNKYKLEHARKYGSDFGLEFIGQRLDIPEIQSTSIEEVVTRKAAEAWSAIQKPLIVSDSGWEIPALGGFPGPYMHDINAWLSAEDFLNLMRDKSDRSIYLNHFVVAVVAGQTKVFSQRTRGAFADIPHGDGSPLDQVVMMDGMDATIAENQARGISSTDDSKLWRDVAEYFNGSHI